jgi:hypothetical protein
MHKPPIRYLPGLNHQSRPWLGTWNQARQVGEMAPDNIAGASHP